VSERVRGLNRMCVVKVPSRSGAIAYWRRELPRHGWKLEGEAPRANPQLLLFSGHGYAADRGRIRRPTAIVIGGSSRSTKVVIKFHQASAG
jgi:hypothetical protein